VTRLVLASSSPARYSLLKAAGIDPEVVIPTADEQALSDLFKANNPNHTTSQLVAYLADAKAESVVGQKETFGALVLGGDSALEFQGATLGKPHLAEVAIERWKQLRGNHGVLHSGHCLIDNRDPASAKVVSKTSSTKVYFANISDAEIEAYVSTGEPLKVAGAFTIDGIGGAFIERIEGDAHTVVGLSLGVLRALTRELGVEYTSLWR
jgi:septum formation protein